LMFAEEFVNTASWKAVDLSAARNNIELARGFLRSAWEWIEKGDWGAATTAADLVKSYVGDARKYASTPTPIPTSTPVPIATPYRPASTSVPSSGVIGDDDPTPGNNLFEVPDKPESTPDGSGWDEKSDPTPDSGDIF
jgi:hypothetical protein